MSASEFDRSDLRVVLEHFEGRVSPDTVKSDLELTCDRCDEHLCDIEGNDNLGVLVSIALDHHCPDEEPNE
jgi:hypothetical protein